MARDRIVLQDLHQAAAWARDGVLGRVAAEGGVLTQIASAQWDDKLSDDQARDLADLLSAMTEHNLRISDRAGHG